MFEFSKIGILRGGLSKEREISLRSGKNVMNTLKKMGFDVIELDITPDLAQKIKENDIKNIYNALHGQYGEDGYIQGFLEVLGVKYTGSKVLGSSICINKTVTKRLIRSAGLPTADFLNVTELDFYLKNRSKIEFPVIVKPNLEGSSIGIEIIENIESLDKYMKKNIDLYGEILIEKYIQGKEITVSVIGTKDPFALPILELVPKGRFYDFYSKYTEGETDFILPAKIDKTLEDKVKKIAVEAHNICYCYGVSRVDMIIKDQIPYILEINTSPGMTDQSDLPAQAREYGYSDEDLISEILKSL